MTAIQNAHRPDCHPCPPIDASNPTHASTKMESGKAVFENDNYRISMGDNNEINIHNKNTNENYQIWGDPHVNVDGQHAFDFWGTTTFELEDGTKLTVDTTPAAGNADVTLASRVTITNGDYGVRVSGIDTNTSGDLHIDEAKGFGGLLDLVTKDGNVLQENPSCKGFLAVDDHGRIHAVDQNYINQTDEKKNCPTTKPGAADPLAPLVDRFKEAFRSIEGLVRVAFSGALQSAHCPQRDSAPQLPAVVPLPFILPPLFALSGQGHPQRGHHAGAQAALSSSPRSRDHDDADGALRRAWRPR